MVWSLFDSLRRRFSPAKRTAKVKGNGVERWRRQLLLETLEDRTVPTSIASSFNATAIAPNDTVWFNAAVSVNLVGTNSATINVTNQTITFSDTIHGVTTPYTVSVPNSVLTFSSTATSATTAFSSSLNEWVTTVPAGISGNVFMAGASFAVPSGGLGGGDKPVTWSANFSTQTTGVSLNWEWSAAAYSSFGSTYSALGVKPCASSTASSYSNADNAGTPESYKTHVVSGVKGTGGSNYTGSYTSTQAVTPTVNNGFISGIVYNDANSSGQFQTTDAGLSGWTVQLYTQTNGVLSSSPRQTTTSDVLGGYTFSGLGALASGSSYVVAEVPPSGWTQSGPSSSTSGTTLLPSGQYGYVFPASTGGILLSSGTSVSTISGSGSVTLNSFSNTVAGSVSYNDGAGDSGSGSTDFSQFNCTYTPSGGGSAISFYTYCIDLFHDVSNGQTVNMYDSSDENKAFVNGSRMAYIYEMWGAQDLSNNPTQAAAVQLALWDLTLNNHNPTSFVKDSDGTYSSGDESVYSVTFNSSAQATAIAPLVNQYLQASVGATVDGAWFNAAANGTGTSRGQSLPIPGPWYNFGNVQASSVGGTVYQDTHGTGVYTNSSSDPGIGGVTLTLSGTNSLGQAVTATTTSGSNGSYNFSSLLPGTYQITETAPSGYLAGSTSVGTVNGASDGSVVASGQIGSISLSGGQAGINYNFGEVQPIQLSGTVYQDTNGSGVYTNSSSDPGIAGVTVTLSGTNGLGQAISATTTTAANGTYSFTADSGSNLLRPGTYKVTETAPSGYLAGATNVGTVNGTSDGSVVASGQIGSIGLTSGQAGINYNFGHVQSITISGMVYDDVNGTGVIGSGDTPFPGVTVTLTGTNGQGQSITASTTTAANGTYSFSTDSRGNVLLPGTYQVTETAPSGYIASGADVGTVNGAADGSNTSATTISSIVMAAGQNGIDYDFGLSVPAAVSGYVYMDYNSNGVFDSGDQGVVGETVTLTWTNSLGQTVSETTTTNASGYYVFAGLLAGTYSISVQSPMGNPEVANVGTVNSVGVGVASSATQIDQVQLLLGNTGVNYDFGYGIPTA